MTTQHATDGELLQRFLLERHDAPFQALLERHGRMVWGVCRRLLADHHHAEDAFQAAFVILAQKAESLRQRESVASWLHRVAYRVALNTARAARRRTEHERRAADMTRVDDGQTWADLRDMLDEEMNRLPERLRAPLVLCYLEGRTSVEAAKRLGWSHGTLRGRLAKAREVLRRRLQRRDLALTGPVLALLLSKHAAAEAVPATCAALTLKAASSVAAGTAVASGILSGKIGTVLEMTMRSMLWTKVKAAAAVVLVCSTVVAGSVVAAQRLQATAPKAPTGMAPQPTPIAAEAQDAPPAAAPAAAQAYRGVLPGDIIVHIRTSALAQSLKNIEAFAIRAVQGTPLAMQLQPGALSVLLLPQIVKLPMGMLDQTQSLQFLMAAPNKPGDKPPVALLLPIPGFTQKIEAIKGQGFAVVEPEPGVYQIAPVQGGGKPTFLADAGNGNVCASHRPAYAKHIADIARRWQQKAPSKDPAAAALVVTVDVGKIMALHRELIDAGIASMDANIQAGQGMEGAPPFAQAMAKVAPNYLKRLADFGEQIKSIRTYLYLDQQALQASTYLTPKAETGLSRFAKAYSALAPAYEQAQYLPDKAAVIECIHHDKQAASEVEAFILDVVRDFLGAVDAESAAVLERTTKQFLTIGDGEGVVAIVPQKDAEGNIAEATSTFYYTCADAAAYRKLMSEATRAVGGFLQALYSQLPMPMPVKVKVDYKENAGTAAGLSYDHFKVGVDLDQENNPQGVPPGAVDNMRKMLEKSQQFLTVLDKTIVVATGTKGEAALGTAIQSLREKRIGLGNDKQFMEALQAASNKQLAFLSLRFLDVVKLIGGQLIAANPMVGGPVAEILRGVPDSQHAITLSVGAKQGKVQADGKANASLRLIVNVPAPAVSEAVVSGMAAFMQYQMLQQGDVPPPAPPGDDKKAPQAF